MTPLLAEAMRGVLIFKTTEPQRFTAKDAKDAKKGQRPQRGNYQILNSLELRLFYIFESVFHC